MKTGFVIVNYNDYDTTKAIVQNISNYSIIDEIVVIDNCSTDNSYSQLLTLQNKKVSIIQSKKNKGYAAGMNNGAKYLIKKYKHCNIIFSNADIVINSEEDIRSLINSLESDDTYGIVAPVIKEKEGLNRGWKIPTPLCDSLLNIVYIHRFLRPKLLYYNEEYYNGIVQVDAVSGCFFCMKSDVLKKANYFDENTFLYYEENIISKKLYSLNYKIMINSNISVFHNHSVTIDKNIHSINKFKILKQSQIYFHKNYNNANLLKILLLHITGKMSLCILHISNFLGGMKK